MPTIDQQVLYPPLVETYMPAFLQNTSCRIYFSNPIFNTNLTIDHVQLAISYMNSNSSALDTSYWPNEIKLCEIYDTTGITTDYHYYVEVDSGDLQEKNFTTGQYYKVQLRFSSAVIDASAMDTDPGATWYYNNLDKFSEWSRVCLIKGIPEPDINMLGLRIANEFYVSLYDNMDWTADQYDVSGFTADFFDSGVLADILLGHNQFVGTNAGYGSMTFVGQYGNTDTSEPLKWYRAKLYLGDTATGNFVDSGILYPDSSYQNAEMYNINGGNLELYESHAIYNGFHFRFDSILVDNTAYTLAIEFTTKNGYVTTKIVNFVTAFEGIEISQLEISPEMDSENGRVKIGIASLIDVSGSLVIRRGDYQNNFYTWEVIYECELPDVSAVNETFYDYDIESGVLYEYWVSGHEFTMMADYEDIFLISGNKQLKIQFNPQVTSFKYAVLDSKIETLGGRYPFIRRNGDVRYREFNLSGLISALTDENNLFATEMDLYNTQADIYREYNITKGITPYTDYTKEKIFRNQVLDFLYDGEVKLFKSPTEGNALVRLTDISLTPVDSLGRMLYSFSAIATEVDEYTILNCAKYDLQVV